jgi:hypothetical protein
VPRLLYVTQKWMRDGLKDNLQVVRYILPGTAGVARVRDQFAIKDMGHGQSGTSICVWAAGVASALKGHRLSTPVRKRRGLSKSPVKLQ